MTNTAVVQEQREVLQVGDTIKVLDSPYDRIKKSAKGRVLEVHGDYSTGETVMVLVNFRVNRQDFPLLADSKRFTFVSRDEVDELPDAEAITIEDEA